MNIDEFSEAGPQNFEYEEVKSMIDSSIEPILGSQIYSPKKVADWTSAIVEAGQWAAHRDRIGLHMH